MAKVLKGSDIIENDLFKSQLESTEKLLKVVKGLKEEYKSLGESSKESLQSQSMVKSAADVKKLQKNTSELNLATKEHVRLEQEEVKLKTKLNGLTTEQAKTNATIKRQTKEQAANLKDLEIVQSKYTGTLEKTAASSRLLRREREKLNLDTQKGRDRLKQINKELDKNNAKIDANSDKLKKQRMNVGNYSESVKGAINSSGLFSRQLFVLQRIQGTLNALTKKNTAETTANATAQQAAAASSGGFSKALRVLRIALISTGIGAIVIGLTALIAAFAGTQRGADLFTKVLRPLSAIFQRFVGFLEGSAFKAFDKLKAAFEDPKQAVIDLGNAIKNNLLKRFEALGILGAAISKIFSGDFQEGFKQLADGTIQLGTGIEDATDKLSDFGDEMGDFVDESVKQGEALDELIKKFERSQIDLVLPLAKARLEFQKLRAIAQDQKKTDEERITALVEAEKQQRFIAASEQSLLDLKIERMELEQSFNDTSREEELELAQLKAERLKQEEMAQKKINGLVSLRSGIELRAQKLSEKAINDTNKLLDDLDARFAGDEFEKKEIKRLQQFEKELVQINNNTTLSVEQKNIIIFNLEKELTDELIALDKAKLDSSIQKQDEELKNTIETNNKQLQEVELSAIKEGKTKEEIDELILTKKIELLKKEIALKEAAGKQTLDVELELARAEIDIEKSKEEKKTQAFENEEAKRKKLIKDTTDFIKSESDKRTAEQLAAIDKDIEASKSREQQLIDSASKGNQIADESIALERERQAQLESERAEALKRQKRIEFSLAAINAYSNRSRSGDENALGNTIKDLTALLAFTNNVQAFEDGGLVEGGEQLVRINEKGKEFVLKHDVVKKAGVEKLNRLNSGDLSALDNRGGDAAATSAMYNAALNQVADKFEKAIKAINQPEKWEMSEITEGLKRVYKEGDQLKNRHYRKQNRLA